MKIPLPEHVSAKIAQRAADNGRVNLERRKWTSSGSLMPVSGDGIVGIRTTVKHLLYQSGGTKPYLMKTLEGRTINIDGRFVRVKGVGQPGYVTLPGGVKIWRQQKWRHPGLQPKRFMEASIQRAIRTSRNDVRAEVMRVLRGDRL